MTNFDYEAVDAALGRPGRMISGSKTVPSGRTGHIIYWNACVFAKMGKDIKQVWYGDLDLTIMDTALAGLAQELNTSIYVSQENPFRWDGWKDGLKSATKTAYEFKSDGGVTKYG